ncbi:MAG: hypothetical protein ACRDDX_05060 [Cellulosilyticaceae bacterium]
MKLQQKVQYKLKNFLYDQERKKSNKPIKTTESNVQDSSTTKVKSALNEIDEYIGEKMQHMSLPKMKKNE